MFACPITLVHASGVHGHVCPSTTGGCAFVYFTVQQSSFLISSPGCLEASLQTAGVPSCVSWVPRLTVLDLRPNWTYEFAFGTELIHTERTYCTLIMDNGH